MDIMITLTIDTTHEKLRIAAQWAYEIASAGSMGSSEMGKILEALEEYKLKPGDLVRLENGEIRTIHKIIDDMYYCYNPSRDCLYAHPRSDLIKVDMAFV